MSIEQHNVYGNNIVEIKLSIDIGRLKSIAETEKMRIKDIFSGIQKSMNTQDIDDSSLPIAVKNQQNDLEGYYDRFIKRHESKLDILKHFFEEEDYFDEIDEASEHLRELIFSFKNKQDDKLTPEVMSHLINEHSKAFEDSEDKEIMKLIIYYLYRHCFIGLKQCD